jgi:catechol 2,3-dioxygenase-like lactoylglutathione lyase family enzyme
MTEARQGIDHVVFSVRDLDAGASFLERAGFKLTPRAEQPFGTSNQMVQMDGNFVDLLGTTSPSKIPPHKSGHFSLAAQHEEQLQRREGLSLVAMISDDARRDYKAFIDGGLQAGNPIDVTRPAAQPDGREAPISFTMVVVPDSRLGDAQHFIYDIRTPDTFWHAGYQDHANGALEITEMVLVADEPEALAAFYTVLISPAAVRRAGNRLEVHTTKGRILVLPPGELAKHFEGIDVPAHAPRPYAAGFQVRTRDLKLVEGCLTDSGIPYVRRGDVVRIAPKDAFGAAIEFIE